MSKRKKRQPGEQELIVYATHEAGHAVVGHVIGRLIDEVSIVASREHGYQGYCSFSTFSESLHGHNQWLKESAKPELVTIQYAGTVAVEILCEMHGWDYEQWQRSNLVDFLFIDEWCHETYTNEKQRSRMKKVCYKQARDILLRHWDAVDMLSVDLLQFGWTPGNEAHRIIRQAIGETEDDWRLAVSNSDHQ
ncbi:MAG: hypothetical protein ACJ788_10980 [Ktedonobacteraceae bacterium]